MTNDESLVVKPYTEVLGKEDSKAFAIIGTRDPDDNQRAAARHLANFLSMFGYQIKTGAAYGIDQEAMEGTNGRNLYVYLPWDSYNRSIIPTGAHVTVYNPSVHMAWRDSVKLYHPAPHYLSRGVLALHARNYGIVENCKGVLAFPQENGGGGTAQGIRIANHLKIPVIQANKNTITDVARWMGNALKQLGLANSDLSATYRSSEFQR